MNHEKDEQSFLWNLKKKIQDNFKNKSLKTQYFKDFSRTTYNSRNSITADQPDKGKPLRSSTRQRKLHLFLLSI